MADKLQLELVTPYKKVLSTEVDELTAPGFIGELGILPGHTPLLTTLRVGELSYKQGDSTYPVAVNWGYLEVEEDRVTVLVDTAEEADEIDLARAKAALGRAEEALQKLTAEDKQYRIMEAALQRALIRIQVASKGR
jgi:F-type H+-transporting ATPase subunit epsilon